LQEGKNPACVDACPEDALAFGEREEMLKLAKGRLADQPGKYIDRVFGEYEVGGTSVLYISDVPLDVLAFQGEELGTEAYPEFTWDWLSKVPAVTLGMGAITTGLLWIMTRRMAAEEAQARKAQQGEQDANE
jgi:formate dehydrogenase iron-sulfur subunit